MVVVFQCNFYPKRFRKPQIDIRNVRKCQSHRRENDKPVTGMLSTMKY